MRKNHLKKIIPFTKKKKIIPTIEENHKINGEKTITPLTGKITSTKKNTHTLH